MSISDEVFKEMKRLYDGGMTQEEVAMHCHIKQQQAGAFLRGTRSTGGLRLETLDKMFPHATISLYGDTVSIHADQNQGSVVGVNRGTIGQEQDILSRIESKIIDADELNDEEKIKVLRVLRKR